MIVTVDLNDTKLVKVTDTHVVVKVGCHSVFLTRGGGHKTCAYCGSDFVPKRIDSVVCDRCKTRYYAAKSLYKRLCQENNEVEVDAHGLVFSNGLPDYLVKQDGSMKASYWYLYQFLSTQIGG